MSSPTPATPWVGYILRYRVYVILHCTVLYSISCTVREYRGTRTDGYSNIGREPAVSQPLAKPPPWSVEDHVNCINSSLITHNLLSIQSDNSPKVSEQDVSHPSSAPFESVSRSFIRSKQHCEKARPTNAAYVLTSTTRPCLHARQPAG
jgi:hypothetical protein